MLEWEVYNQVIVAAKKVLKGVEGSFRRQSAFIDAAFRFRMQKCVHTVARRDCINVCVYVQCVCITMSVHVQRVCVCTMSVYYKYDR